MSPVRRGHSELSVGRPSLGPMTATGRPTGPRPRRDGAPRGRRRAAPAPSLAVPEPRRRLQDLPAALPLPHHRPAARAQEPRRRSAARWCTRCWSGSTTSRPPSAPSRRPRSCSEPAWAELREEPGVAELFAVGAGRRRGDRALGAGVGRGVAGLGRQAGREVLHAGGPDPHPAARPRGAGRGHAARRPAAARLRRPARRRPERRAAGRRLQDRRGAARGVRGQGPVPDEVLRAGALAHPRRGRRPAEAALPQGRRRAHLRARRGRAGPLRAHPRRRSGRRSSARSRPATSGPTRPGSATGATTRRSARPSAALPRRSRPRPPRPPAGNTLPVVALD